MTNHVKKIRMILNACDNDLTSEILLYEALVELSQYHHEIANWNGIVRAVQRYFKKKDKAHLITPFILRDNPTRESVEALTK